jgi:hypothetical protein
MNSYNNLDPSLFSQHDNHMPPNDIQADYQTPSMTQNYDTFQQLPGAEVIVPPTFCFSRTAEPSFRQLLPHRNTQMERASFSHSPPSTDSQSERYPTSSGAPSREGSISPLTSQGHILQASHPSKSQFPRCVVALRRILRTQTLIHSTFAAGYSFIPKSPSRVVPDLTLHTSVRPMARGWSYSGSAPMGTWTTFNLGGVDHKRATDIPCAGSYTLELYWVRCQA